MTVRSLVAPLLIAITAGCVHLTTPAPYFADSLSDLKNKTVSFYDGLIAAPPGDPNCRFSANSDFWMKSERTLTILKYRVAVREEDGVLAEPLDTLVKVFAQAKNAQETAEKSPVTGPTTVANRDCLAPQMAALDSARIEDGIDHLLILQQKRKDASK